MEVSVSKRKSVYTSKPAACIHTEKFMGMDYESIPICNLPLQLNAERSYQLIQNFVKANL